MGDSEECQREEEVAFLGRQLIFRDQRDHAVVLDDLHNPLLPRHGGADLPALLRRPPAPNPQRYRRNGEVDRYQHRAGQIRPDAHEPTRPDEQVKEEALVQVLQQVVQAAERALHDFTQIHLVVPPVAHSLQRHCIHVVRYEAAVRP